MHHDIDIAEMAHGIGQQLVQATLVGYQRQVLGLFGVLNPAGNGRFLACYCRIVERFSVCSVLSGRLYAKPGDWDSSKATQILRVDSGIAGSQILRMGVGPRPAPGLRQNNIVVVLAGFYNASMCGKAAVSHLSWKQVYEYASALTAPGELPPDPEFRINISPSRQLRKSEPDSMVWETLPVIRAMDGIDQPGEAIWPFIPAYSEGRLPLNKDGRLISTANARLRHEGKPFAPTFMGAWGAQWRVIVVVSWFYEFDSRVKPQVPYAVFPLDAPFWMMAGLARETTFDDHSQKLTVAVITVDPNDVLQSVGHHRSPALLRSGAEARTWLHGTREEARQLLRPHANETMGVEAIDMGIKIPGNQKINLPGRLAEWGAG